MATLADIAKQAQVSTGTVSRVLNNKMNMPISQPTIERIKRAAEELGYRPNPMARALATGKTRAIGLYYHSVTETMFIRILEAVEAAARARRYHLIVSSDVASFSAEAGIDGLIYIGVLDNFSDDLLPRSKPVMFVGPSYEADSRPNLVTWSEFDAACMAVEHLVTLGHRRIGALWGHYQESGPVPPRVAGFRAALARSGATGAEQFDERHPDPIYAGYLQTCRLLERDASLTALFARNDYVAMGALKALHQAGIAVPAQMSVIHYGDSVLSRAAYPELTSVSHPNAEASVMALERLIDRIEKGVEDFPAVSLPITLCQRDSCAPPPPPPGGGAHGVTA